MKNVSLAFASVLLICFTSNSLAVDSTNSRLTVEVQNDQNGNYSPNVLVPISWSEHWFSSASYIDSTQFTTTTLTGFSQSKDGTTVDDRRTGLNILSYTNGNEGFQYSIGLNYQEIAINKEEFGYFHLVLTNPATNSWVAFDNQVQIKSTEWALRGDVTFKSDTGSNYMFRIGAIVAPVSSMSVSQQTDFQPIVASTGTSNSNGKQDTYWQLDLDARYRITDWLSFGVDGRYEVLPMKYQIAQLSTSLNGFTYANENVVETTSRLGAKLIYIDPNQTLNPYLGIATESVSDQDSLAGATTTTNQSSMILGLIGSF